MDLNNAKKCQFLLKCRKAEKASVKVEIYCVCLFVQVHHDFIIDVNQKLISFQIYLLVNPPGVNVDAVFWLLCAITRLIS